MSLIDAVSGLEAAASDTYETWKGYNVPYLNGDVIGCKELLDAADAFDNAKDDDLSYTDIANIRGEFVYQLLKKMNDISETDAKKIATKDNMNELLKVWTQSTEQ